MKISLESRRTFRFRGWSETRDEDRTHHKTHNFSVPHRQTATLTTHKDTHITHHMYLTSNTTSFLMAGTWNLLENIYFLEDAHLSSLFHHISFIHLANLWSTHLFFHISLRCSLYGRRLASKKRDRGAQTTYLIRNKQPVFNP
jgi:hypothetical protein